MPLADSFDSAPAYAFKVTIDGIEIPKVTEVSGLKIEVDKIELKQQLADGKYVVRNLPGRSKVPGEITVTALATAGTHTMRPTITRCNTTDTAAIAIPISPYPM